MIGIRPTDNNWNETSDEIYDELDEHLISNGLSAYFVSTCADKTVNPFTDIQCHNIVLLNDNNVNLNKLLVEKNLAEIDPDTETAFDDIPFEKDSNESLESININDDNATDSNDGNEGNGFIDLVDICMDDEAIIEFMNQMCQQRPETSETSKATEQQKENEIIPIQSTSNNMITVSDDATLPNGSDENVNITMNHRLIYKDQNARRPEVYWQQCNDMIKLKIPASDKVKYNLEIACESLIYRYVQYL